MKGRLFEVTNPVSAGQYGGDFVQRIVIPRVAHEGLAFDRGNNLYFVDELNGGSIYKYVSANPDATSGDDFFAAGQTFVLRVGCRRAIRGQQRTGHYGWRNLGSDYDGDWRSNSGRVDGPPGWHHRWPRDGRSRLDPRHRLQPS